MKFYIKFIWELKFAESFWFYLSVNYYRWPISSQKSKNLYNLDKTNITSHKTSLISNSLLICLNHDWIKSCHYPLWYHFYRFFSLKFLFFAWCVSLTHQIDWLNLKMKRDCHSFLLIMQIPFLFLLDLDCFFSVHTSLDGMLIWEFRTGSEW